MGVIWSVSVYTIPYIHIQYYKHKSCTHTWCFRSPRLSQRTCRQSPILFQRFAKNPNGRVATPLCDRMWLSLSSDFAMVCPSGIFQLTNRCGPIGPMAIFHLLVKLLQQGPPWTWSILCNWFSEDPDVTGIVNFIQEGGLATTYVSITNNQEMTWFPEICILLHIAFQARHHILVIKVFTQQLLQEGPCLGHGCFATCCICTLADIGPLGECWMLQKARCCGVATMRAPVTCSPFLYQLLVGFVSTEVLGAFLVVSPIAFGLHC